MRVLVAFVWIGVQIHRYPWQMDEYSAWGEPRNQLGRVHSLALLVKIKCRFLTLNVLPYDKGREPKRPIALCQGAFC